MYKCNTCNWTGSHGVVQQFSEVRVCPDCHGRLSVETKLPEKKACHWEYDRLSEYWVSGCENHFSFSGHYSPLDNDMIFCPFCGKELKEKS